MGDAGEMWEGDEARNNVENRKKDSIKWTTKDKIKQLKGIIDLHEKTLKWTKLKKDVAIKKYQIEGRELDLKTEKMRKLLKQIEHGASEEIKDILKNDKQAWLICRDQSQNGIIESLKHLTFLQRRELDRLTFDLTKTKQNLFDIKLEDKLLASGMMHADRIESEKYRIQEIAVEIEQAKTQPEAAMLVEKTYERRRRILKKESLDIDSLLDGLKNDVFIQTECILMAAEMGQLATEEKANFMEKYRLEMKLANQEKNAYSKEIKHIKNEISRVKKINQSLARADSGFYKIGIAGGDEKMKAIEELKEKVREREEELQALMSVTTTATPEELFPKIEDAMRRMSTCSRKLDEYQVLKDLQILRHQYMTRALQSLSSHDITQVKNYIETRDDLLERLEDYKRKIAEHKKHIANIEKYLLEVAAKVYYFYFLFMEVKIGDPGPQILDMVQEDEDDDIFEGEESRLLIEDDFSQKSPSETSSAIPTIDANVSHMLDVITLKINIILKDMKEYVRRKKEQTKGVRPQDDFLILDSDSESVDSSDEEIMADEDYQLDNFLGAITGYTDDELTEEEEKEEEDLMSKHQPPSRQELKNKSTKIAETKEKEEEPKTEDQKKKIKVKKHACF
ncbi:hypothetical protein GE061_005479 [Apolygus lucorum]|uniref:Uncharacterized protein n=1 Tax=Apolygus lucorum TaxID=248454 RepID=A0A8S9WWC5_APOLU|nr:hypothetical protein GE061_005479 [Apolygus lucorum]